MSVSRLNEAGEMIIKSNGKLAALSQDYFRFMWTNSFSTAGG